MGGHIHAVHVHVWPEDADSSVNAAVRFHALEELGEWLNILEICLYFQGDFKENM